MQSIKQILTLRYSTNLETKSKKIKPEDFKKEPDNRSWFDQAMDAGAVNADLYDNADAIFDINNTKDARELSNTELQAYIDLVNKSIDVPFTKRAEA